jgi:hypothetical protein
MVFRSSHTRIMAPKHPKRPRDLNQWAKRMVDLATGSAQEPDPYEGKNPEAVKLGQRGGVKGGQARAAKLTPERRAEIARKAALTRWAKKRNPGLGLLNPAVHLSDREKPQLQQPDRGSPSCCR